MNAFIPSRPKELSPSALNRAYRCPRSPTRKQDSDKLRRRRTAWSSEREEKGLGCRSEVTRGADFCGRCTRRKAARRSATSAGSTASAKPRTSLAEEVRGSGTERTARAPAAARGECEAQATGGRSLVGPAHAPRDRPKKAVRPRHLLRQRVRRRRRSYDGR